MAGRRSHHDDRKRPRDQAEKKVRGFARGHGAHHRMSGSRGAPRPLATGKDRTMEGAKRRNFGNLGEDELLDLTNVQRRADADSRLEEVGEAHGFGAKLDGKLTRGVVVEVRKGNFLTRMSEDSPPDEASGEFRWRKGELLRTFARGVMQQFDLGLSSLVAPGDDVELIVPPSSGKQELMQSGLHAILTRVLPRHSEFRRVHPSGRAIQTLAANVDRIIIVASVAEPDFRPGFIDRVLVCAAASNLPAAIVLNKIDLGIDSRDIELLNVYRGLGVQIIQTSAFDKDMGRSGLEQLKTLLTGACTVFTGHSGVGKSSLLVELNPALEPEIRMGDVSTQTGKGTHTTTHARLFSLEFDEGRTAELIDTPGVREFTPADTDARNLWGWFPEIAALQGQCAFPDCTHTVEKGCAVLKALEAGEIHPRRHRSYVRMLETLPV